MGQTSVKSQSSNNAAASTTDDTVEEVTAEEIAAAQEGGGAGPSSRMSTRGSMRDPNESTDDFLQRILSDNRAALMKAKRAELGVESGGEDSDGDAAEAEAAEGASPGSRAATGTRRARAGGAGGVQSDVSETKAVMNDNLVKLHERGEKVSRLGKATAGLMEASREFSQMFDKSKK
jgi:hypothetical protein